MTAEPSSRTPTAGPPAAHRALAHALADRHDGVVSRKELAAVGVSRHVVRRNVDAERWMTHGHQTVAVHTRPLSLAEQHWRAVWEVGARIAALDGLSALHAAGLSGITADVVHVSVPHTARVEPVPGVRIHKITGRLPGEVVEPGAPRVRPVAAAVRAAHWAVSDRQAALILATSVQQGLVTAEALHAAGRLIRGRRRRAFVAQVLADLVDGSQSLGELDFARLCRRHRLPDPSRQVMRRGPLGRIYLDARWDDYGVVVEVDGSGHRVGLAVTSDNLRQNHVALSGDIVLRIDLLGLRVSPEAFVDQLATALQLRGYRPDEVVSRRRRRVITSTGEG